MSARFASIRPTPIVIRRAVILHRGGCGLELLRNYDMRNAKAIVDIVEES
jgi:hypothetical protein